MTNGNEPITAALEPNYLKGGGTFHNGLTKREYFAAMAMQGVVCNHAMIDTDNWKWLATESVKIADTLISELNKTT